MNKSNYLKNIGKTVFPDQTEESIKFWQSIESNIDGVKIHSADGTIHHITLNLKAQYKLEDLRGLLEYVEKLLPMADKNINSCTTEDVEIVEVLKGLVKYEKIVDSNNSDGIYCPTSLEEKKLKKKYDRVDFFEKDNEELNRVTNNIQNQNNIQVETNNGNIANELKNGTQYIDNNKFIDIANMIETNKDVLVSNGIKEKEVDEVITTPTKEKLQKFSSKLVDILKVSPVIVEIFQKITEILK